MADKKPDPKADYWTLQDVADFYGIKYESARKERTRGHLPPEDKLFGRSPVWRPATIINHPRPGQGARTDLRQEADGG
jgi:hypothetical protein